MMTLKLFKSFILSILVFSIIMMMFSKHPMLLGFMTILQSMIVSFYMSVYMKFSWFSFLMFMIYLGGILMLFSYIISITTSEEKLLMNNIKITPVILISILTTMPIDYQLFKNFYVMKLENMLNSSFSLSSKISILLMTFLLLIMIFVVFMTDSNKSNLKSSI